MVRHNINQMSLKMHSYFSDLPDGGELYLDTHLKSNVANNVGLWIGYRGYGVGYSVGFGPKGGTWPLMSRHIFMAMMWLAFLKMAILLSTNGKMWRWTLPYVSGP